MGRRLRKNRWVGERNRKKPKTSKTSPFLWQTEKEWWMGSKGISKPWKILLTDFIARHDEKSEVWKGTGSAAAELNSFEASGEVTHCPKTLIGVISHAKGLRSEVCILMFIMEWMLWLFLSKQPFFFPPPKMVMRLRHHFHTSIWSKGLDLTFCECSLWSLKKRTENVAYLQLRGLKCSTVGPEQQLLVG